MIGCKKEADPCCDASNPNCENYDPCLGKKTINTYFNVRPGDNGFPPPPEWCNLVPTDTFNSGSVRFDAPNGNPNSTYEWQIGTEIDKRLGNGFEVDFSTYLNAGNWESFINITLNIRTPPNSCLSNLDDTLVTVNRELFFTNKTFQIILANQKTASYKGYFTSNKNKEVIIQFIQQDSGSFRGENAPVFLTVGLPNIDTLMFPSACAKDFCYNYIQTKRKILLPDQCNSRFSNAYFSSEDWILLNGAEKIKRIWEFSPPSGNQKYEFIGDRI